MAVHANKLRALVIRSLVTRSLVVLVASVFFLPALSTSVMAQTLIIPARPAIRMQPAQPAGVVPGAVAVPGQVVSPAGAQVAPAGEAEKVSPEK